MSELLKQAVSELTKRSEREQDDIARDILARIGQPAGHALQSAFGRGRSELALADPEDTLVDILTDEDVAAWYVNVDPANP